MSLEKKGPASDGERDKISRRRFLGLVARGAVVAGALAGNPAKAFAQTPEADNTPTPSFEKIEKHYRETGEVIHPRSLYPHLQSLESARMRTNYGREAEIGAELAETLTQLALGKVKELYDGQERGRPEAERLYRALNQFFASPTENMPAGLQNIWQITTGANQDAFYYNRDMASVNDVVLNRRLQCRSGTQFFLRAAAEILSDDDFENLVLIYTRGHVLPGYKHESGNYIGLEMTADVQELPEFSPSDASSFPLRIVRAHHATIENILGRKIHPQEVILKENFPDQAESNKPDSYRITTVQRRPGLYIVPSVYSFGSAEVPEGDHERRKVDSISGDTPVPGLLGSKAKPAESTFQGSPQ